jgi:anaerobic selenocysteine-containing dehydrogenase
MSSKNKFRVEEDTWVKTQCGRCFSTCAIRVRRVNGVAVRIEGEPDSWMGSRGGVCGKGAAGLQVLYDPNRLNVPLRRTNPEKGLYVDPKWKEISWDEALNEIAQKLKHVIEDDPRKIFLQSTTVRSPTASLGWRNMMARLLGTANNSVGGAGIHCGNGAHEACSLMHGSWDIMPDLEYCNYAIYWGVNNGHATGHAALITARRVAEAMERGMKLVVFDPICNYSASKATEWIPIIPGTDGAVLLAMCNVILNELKIWDDVYLKNKTNAPYLVGQDGRYVRDQETWKPLIWDAGESKPKVYDEPGVREYALEGMYTVDGVVCSPAFTLLREHLRAYTPQMASEVSSVPPNTIRRIATEYAEAAQIGRFITIDGHRLPLRPVSSTIFRGGEGHENAFHTSMGVCLLNHVLGAADVPGGTVGLPNTCYGYPDTGKFRFGVVKGPDGLLSVSQFYQYGSAWPIGEPKFPTDAALQELFQMCKNSSIWAVEDREEIWEKIGLPYRFEVMLNFGCNSVMGMASPESQADFLKRIPFIVSWDLFSNEFAEGFADILLPDTSYLETFTWLDGQAYTFNYPYGMEPWCYHVAQPVVKPGGERRYIMDASFDLLDRIGKRAELNEYWNRFIGLDEEERFGANEKITWEKVGDRGLKHYFGSEHGVEWFKKSGCIIWPKKVEEAYWRYFSDVRVPVYMEWMIDLKDKTKTIAEQVDIHMNWDQYTPFISWFPCTPHKVKDPSFDLYCFSYRDILHTASSTMEQPWLDEASKMNPYTYNVTMNSGVATRRGLKDGDVVKIESIYERKVMGILKTREGQHPNTLGIAGTAGHWSRGQPIARGKGTNFNFLMKAEYEACDPIVFNLETCVKVRVGKVNGG